ncbi:HIV Tat-specific factor 1, partial [Homalodisca vitripennis]
KESVDLALNLLDGYDVRGHRITVERAKFTMKGDAYNPSLKPKKKRKKDKEKLKKIQEKLFDWRPDKMRGERSKHEKIVIVKNLFDPTMFNKDVKLILEYQQDLRDECLKCGGVKKVVIYDKTRFIVKHVGSPIVMVQPQSANVELRDLSNVTLSDITLDNKFLSQTCWVSHCHGTASVWECGTEGVVPANVTLSYITSVNEFLSQTSWVSQCQDAASVWDVELRVLTNVTLSYITSVNEFLSQTSWRHPEGVAQINFKEIEAADACVQLLNGRWFGQRKITAETWDGKTKYKMSETDEQIKARLQKWEKFLESGESAKEEQEKKEAEKRPDTKSVSEEESVNKEETKVVSSDRDKVMRDSDEDTRSSVGSDYDTDDDK